MIKLLSVVLVLWFVNISAYAKFDNIKNSAWTWSGTALDGNYGLFSITFDSQKRVTIILINDAWPATRIYAQNATTIEGHFEIEDGFFAPVIDFGNTGRIFLRDNNCLIVEGLSSDFEDKSCFRKRN